MLLQEFTISTHFGSFDPETTAFVQRWHYSKSARSLRQVVWYKLWHKETLIGVAVYGSPMNRLLDNPETLELRRLCLIDDTPRNSESYFIAKTIKHIKRNFLGVKRIISFADPNKGHVGTIYKASNFKLDGHEKNGNPRIAYYKALNKYIHLRQVYQKKSGEYTKNAKELQDKIKLGDVVILKQLPKLRYIYTM